MKLTIKLTVLFTAVELISFVESRNYVMEELCGEMVKLDSYREHSAELVQTKRIKYQQDSNCIVRLKTESSYRFIVVFKKVDIEYEPMCDDDYLKVLDGNTTSSPTVKGLAKKICGYGKPPGSYVTTGRYITLQFRSDSWANEDGFEILLTVFREVPCTDDEFKCRNNRCIAARLQCDGSNNCGDYSDECQLSPTVILAIIASVFIVTILGIGIMLYVRNFRNGRGKKNNKTDDWSIFKTEEQIPEILRNRCPHHKTPKSTREEQGESIPKPSCSTKQEQNGVELKVENLCHGHQGNPSELSSKKSAAKC